MQQLAAALANYESNFQLEYSIEHDHFKLIGQDNLRSYRPLDRIAICVGKNDALEEIILRAAAVTLTGHPPRFFLMPDLESEKQSILCQSRLYASIQGKAEPFMEDAVIDKIEAGEIGRFRLSTATSLPSYVAGAAHNAGVAMIDAPVSFNGMVELAWYFREQSLSMNYHRYGNLGTRSLEVRSETR